MKKISSALISSILLSLAVAPVQAETLQDVYLAAQKSDPELAAAEANYEAQLQNKPIARSALLPQINGNVGFDRIDQEYDLDSASTFFSDSEIDRTSWGISLSQAIYRKDYLTQLAQADAGVAQAKAEIETARQDLIIRSAQAYFDVLTAEVSLTSAQAEKKAVEQQYDQAQERFDVGLIAITDVRESRAQLDISIASEIAAQAQLDTAKENLAAIIGYMPETLEPLSDSLALQSPEPSDIKAWEETAKENNLQIQAAQYGVEAAKEGVENKKSGHHPTLDLVASYGDQDDSDGSSAGTVTNTTIGLDLNIPLYSGGRTSAQVSQAKSQYKQAQKNLELAERSAVKQTRASYLNVLSNISRVEALSQVLKSTQTAAEAAEAGFEVGTRTSVDVLVALRQVYSSKRDYSEARHNYVLSALLLKQAAGTLSEQDLSIVDISQ